MSRPTKKFVFHVYDEQAGKHVNITRLLACTSQKVHLDMGRTAGNIKATRSIWKDEDGNEYVCHKRFLEPLTLEYLSGHGTITRL